MQRTTKLASDADAWSVSACACAAWRYARVQRHHQRRHTEAGGQTLAHTEPDQRRHHTRVVTVGQRHLQQPSKSEHK